MDCPFCDIWKKKTERLIRETEHTFSVLSNPRLVPGHLLVIPKRHVEKFSELTPFEQKDLFDEVILIEEKMLQTIANGCDVSQHFRPFIAQSKLKINHLHIHVRPRTFKDELYEKVQRYETDIFTELSEEEFQKYKSLFQK